MKYRKHSRVEASCSLNRDNLEAGQHDTLLQRLPTLSGCRKEKKIDRKRNWRPFLMSTLVFSEMFTANNEGWAKKKKKMYLTGGKNAFHFRAVFVWSESLVSWAGRVLEKFLILKFWHKSQH